MLGHGDYDTTNFNPHSREGSDAAVGGMRNLRRKISIHTPAKGVTQFPGEGFKMPAISIHTPAKGVTGQLNGVTKYSDISIHTPAKGVTAGEQAGVLYIYISIHTPAKGVTETKRHIFL